MTCWCVMVHYKKINLRRVHVHMYFFPSKASECSRQSLVRQAQHFLGTLDVFLRRVHGVHLQERRAQVLRMPCGERMYGALDSSGGDVSVRAPELLAERLEHGGGVLGQGFCFRGAVGAVPLVQQRHVGAHDQTTFSTHLRIFAGQHRQRAVLTAMRPLMRHGRSKKIFMS